MDILSLSQFAGLLPILREVIAFIWWLLPTSVQEVLLWQFVYLPLILALWFIVAIQYKKGGWWRLLTPLALRTGLLDVYLNYTTFSVYLGGRPQDGENTLSKRCKRLVFDPGWRGFIARLIARFTNRFDKDHIPLP
jgi:hypothetical protein